jgi:protein-tyrosine phosphatase
MFMIGSRWFVAWGLVLGCLSCGTNESRTNIRNGGDAALDAEGNGEADATGTAGQAGYAGQASAGGAGGNAGHQEGGVVPPPAGGAVVFPGVFNARNEGGYLTVSGQRIKHQVLIRSGHLADLGASGCQRFEELSIRSVLDLRAADDAASNPDAACVTQHASYTLVDLPKILPPSVDAYRQTLDATEPKLSIIFSKLSEDGALPAIVHCVIGRDRASLVSAVLLLALGVSQEDVKKDFVDNQDDTVHVEAAWLSPLLDRVDGAGGIEPYLLSHGVTQAMIERFRVQALE